MTNSSHAAPRWLRIFAIFALLWTFMGVAAFVMQKTMNLEELAKTDAYTARIFAAMPGWVWGAYAVAVIAALAGAVALLLRHRFAVMAYFLSLAAVIVQFGYSFLGTDILAVKGASAAIFPAVIILIAIVQWSIAQKAFRRGWLN